MLLPDELVKNPGKKQAIDCPELAVMYTAIVGSMPALIRRTHCGYWYEVEADILMDAPTTHLQSM